MVTFIKKNKYIILLWIFILAYIGYFSYFTILRYKTLYASYYDLGIMHQTVYNTYQSIKTGDWGRFLELTNTIGPDQIKRIAIHNDILLVLLAPFYFINPGPETLLVIQTVTVALGALAIFKIANIVLQKNKNVYFLSLIFSLVYLLYFPLERANIYDFHAVTLSTSLLLFMFYFWLVRKYTVSFLFFLFSIFSKEQVALTTFFFAIYVLTTTLHSTVVKRTIRGGLIYTSVIALISIVWFVLSIFYFIPLFRGGDHFAVGRYSDFGGSPIRIITGIITNPYSISKYLFSSDTLRYLLFLLGPVGFLSLFSPIQLLVAMPEFAINLLSNNPNMRNVIYHYTAVITPFVFLSAIYGGRNLTTWLKNLRGFFDSSPFGDSLRMIEKNSIKIVALLLLLFSITFSYFKGPLPFTKKANIHPFKYPQKEAKDTAFWAKTLKDERLKISTTGQLSPFFTSRRYFYTFSQRYQLADYVIVRLNEIYNYPEKNELIPVYEKLKEDYNYQLIYQKENFEVYKRIKI